MTAFQELKLLTLSETASILQISKRTLLRMIQQGDVPAFKVGGQWRIRETQFRKWVEEKESSLFSSDYQNEKKKSGINKTIVSGSRFGRTNLPEDSS